MIIRDIKVCLIVRDDAEQYATLGQVKIYH